MTEQTTTSPPPLLIGVLALQGAFEEHQTCLESSASASSVTTRQVKTPADLEGLDGIVLPGGESTAMGLIGTATTRQTNNRATATTARTTNLWDALKEFILVENKPCWGTCAGMILLAERCVGASAVIENGQSLIGGMDILVCRNYFGSQVSSFEMATPPPPQPYSLASSSSSSSDESSYPGVFIRAPAILSAGPDVTVLGKVVATPCRQAAVVLQELEEKIAKGETVIQMGVVDVLDRKSSQEITYRVVVKHDTTDDKVVEEEKKETNNVHEHDWRSIELPGAADESNAREVICAVQKDNLLCTAFHPELTNDYRWHAYFVGMVRENKERKEAQ